MSFELLTTDLVYLEPKISYTYVDVGQGHTWSITHKVPVILRAKLNGPNFAATHCDLAPHVCLEMTKTSF